MKRLIKIFTGIVLLPFLAGFAIEFFKILQRLHYGFAIHPAFLFGAAAYAILHIFFHKPIMSYVFAHEFTHALWASLFGGSLKAFRASRFGGHVVVTRSNMWVAIAPYFFPFYTFLVLSFWGFLDVVGIRDKSFVSICFMTGLSLAFHMAFTGHSLIKKQRDFKKGGWLLSVVLILIFNIISIILIFEILDPDAVQVQRFLNASIDHSVGVVLQWLNP